MASGQVNSSQSAVIASNAMWSAMDIVVGMLTAIVSSAAVARVMGPEALGHYNYVLWLATITGTFATFGIPIATRRFASQYYTRGDHEMASSILYRTLQIQGVTAIAVTAAMSVWVHFSMPADRQLYSYVAVVSQLPYMLLSIVTQANLVREDFRSNVIPSVLSTIVNFAVTMATLAFHWGLVGLTSALLISRTFDFAWRFTKMRQRFPYPSGGLLRLPPDVKQRMWRFCVQTSVLFVINTVVWNRTEFFFLERYCAITELTFFSLGFNLIEKIALIPQVFSSAAGTTLMVRFERDSMESTRLTVQSLRYTALLAFPLMVGITAVSDSLIRAIYGPMYIAAILPLVIQAMLTIPKVLLQPAQHLLITMEKQGFLWRWGLVCAVLNVGLDISWIPSGGAVAASWANGLTQAVAALGIWVYVIRLIRMPIPTVFLLKLAGSALVMAVVARSVSVPLLPALGLPAGIAAGALVFFVCLRLTRALDGGDRERLLKVPVPGSMRPLFQRSVQLIAG